MSNLSVSAALEARLLAMPQGIAAAHTQFENTDYTPEGETPYQRVWLLPAKPFNYGGTTKAKRLLGIFQIDLCFPYGGGSGDAKAHAEAVADWFPQGLSVTANNVTTTVDLTPEVKSGRVQGDRWVIPIRVSYFANMA